jgi:hypothetical protein
MWMNVQLLRETPMESVKIQMAALSVYAIKLFLLSSFNVITASNIVTNEDIAFFNNWNLIKSLKKLYP